MNSKFTPPFKTLGTRLKYLREHSSETLAEVSGAVEINEDKLELFEQGVERPSEEILMLLISHFEMHDMDAVQLWELAGYDRRATPDIMNIGTTDDFQNAKSLVMMLAFDTRTQYSDGVDINVNNAGVVMNFSQANGQGQQQTISRIGMSLQQAEAVSEALQQAILHARYASTKALPARAAAAPAPKPKTTTKKTTTRKPRTSRQSKLNNDTGKQ